MRLIIKRYGAGGSMAVRMLFHAALRASLSEDCPLYGLQRQYANLREWRAG